MEKVIMGTRLPAKLWLDEVEDSCMSQIMDLTSLPFAFKHIAIMPDAHAGKGMPIGGVLATNGVIVPNAVGVDIGCGIFLNLNKVISTSQSSYLLQTSLVLILQNRHLFKVESLRKQFLILLFILMIESQRNNCTNLRHNGSQIRITKIFRF